MITIYTKPMCSGCEQIKDALRRLGMEFQEVPLTDENIADIATELRLSGIITKLDEIAAPVLCVPDRYGNPVWMGYEGAAKLFLGGGKE